MIAKSTSMAIICVRFSLSLVTSFRPNLRRGVCTPNPIVEFLLYSSRDGFDELVWLPRGFGCLSSLGFRLDVNGFRRCLVILEQRRANPAFDRRVIEAVIVADGIAAHPSELLLVTGERVRREQEAES